jgi:hypothetical protein
VENLRRLHFFQSHFRLLQRGFHFSIVFLSLRKFFLETSLELLSGNISALRCCGWQGYYLSHFSFGELGSNGMLGMAGSTNSRT